jgi:hypothetical protein
LWLFFIVLADAALSLVLCFNSFFSVALVVAALSFSHSPFLITLSLLAFSL